MDFHYTLESNKSFPETISSIEIELKQDGFGVLWNFDVREKLQSKGLNFENQCQVLEVCNPKEAYRVLSQDMLAGYFLPCKIVVYTKEEKTYIGMIKPSLLMSIVESQELKLIAEEIEGRLMKAMDRSVEG